MSNKQIKNFILPALLIFLLCGCGQKGDLYLPPPVTEVPANSNTEPKEK